MLRRPLFFMQPIPRAVGSQGFPALESRVPPLDDALSAARFGGLKKAESRNRFGKA